MADNSENTLSETALIAPERLPWSVPQLIRLNASDAENGIGGDTESFTGSS